VLVIRSSAGSAPPAGLAESSGQGSHIANASASGSTIEEKTPDSQTITIKLRDLLESGDPTFNIPVYGGDVVSVPRSGIVYVAGAVQSPGGYVLQDRGEQVTTLKAIALAHGLKSTAKANNAVIVRANPQTGKKEEIPVHLKTIMAQKTEDVRLYPNDLLFVPDSTGKRVLYRSGEAAIAIGSGLAIVRSGSL
jgi:protein involved in polysaccharide export with SLBB domain